MAYQSFFATNTATKPGATASKAGSGYTSFFGNTVQKNNTYAANDADQQKKQQQSKQQVQQPAAQQQAKQSLFSKVKTAGKQLVTDAVHIGEKSANTVAAGVGGTVEAGVAGVQSATGHKEAAKKTIASANKNVDALLDHGVGNQGGYISSQGATGSNPKAVVKAIAKGATDITPFVVPGAKGGSLLSKVARDAVANGIVGAGGTAAQEKLNGQKLDAKEIAKGAAVNAAFAVGVHGVTAGSKGVISKLGKNKEIPAQPQVPTATHEVPQPGDVIQPTKPALDPNTGKALHDTMANVHQPQAAIDAEAAQKAATEETAKQSEQTAKDVAKATESTKKIDQQLEVYDAKAKDAKDGKLSNVDQVKVKQLKEQKAELAQQLPEAAASVEKPTAVPATTPKESLPDAAKPEPAQPTTKPGEVSSSKTTPEQTKFRSRVYERLQQEQPEVLKGDVKYQGVNLKQDAEKAVKLVEADKNKAYRVAMGHETSSDVTATSVNIALAEKALQDGNHSLYAQLVKNRSLRLTRAGQEIVAEKGSVTDNSTSRYVKELVNARLGKLGNGYLGDMKTKLGKASTKERAISQIDHEVTKAQRKIAGKQLDLSAAQKLIDSLAC